MHHGKEIYTFFGRYHIFGLLGIIISSSVLGLTINKTLKIIFENNINNYNDFIIKLFKGNKYGKKIINIINIIINIFLLATFYIMMAGLSSYFKQKYNISNYITSIVAAFICYIVLCKNTDGVIKISSICVPIIIIFITLIGGKYFQNSVYKLTNLKVDSLSDENITVFIIFKSIASAVLYSGYNSIILIPVVISLKKNIKVNNSKIIGILISIFLIILGFFVFGILLIGNIQIMQLDMPIAFIIKKFESKYEFLYGVVLVISIFTSIISAELGFLKNCSKNKLQYKRYLKIICISSIFISNIGFSKLIDLLYPLFGIFGIILQFMCLSYL